MSFFLNKKKTASAQTQSRAGLSWRREDQRPPSPQATPPLPPPPRPADDHDASWIYFPKGDGGNTLDEWLTGTDSSGDQMAAYGCNSSDAGAALSSGDPASSHSPLAAARSVGNCSRQWLVDIAQNGAAAGSPGGDAGAFAGGERVGGGVDGEKWPPWPGDFGGNFTFYDYDYDSSGKRKFPPGTGA